MVESLFLIGKNPNVWWFQFWSWNPAAQISHRTGEVPKIWGEIPPWNRQWHQCLSQKKCLSTHSCCFDPPYLVGYTFILDCLMLCLPPFSWWNPNFWGLNPVKSAFLRGSRMLNPYVQWLIHPISQVFSPHRSLPESWNGQGTPE